MSISNKHDDEGPVGRGAAISEIGPDARFKWYVADRPAQVSGLRAAEIAVDVSITIAAPVRVVWPVFKDFNRWMNRFGYMWDDGVPADNEDRFVYLSNRPGANEFKYGQSGLRIKYIARKVVPQRLIYFDSLPSPIPDRDCMWTGHNLMTLFDEGQQTRMEVFMEHTWYSATMSIEELRAEARGVIDAGRTFWREFFVPDLLSAVAAELPQS